MGQASATRRDVSVDDLRGFKHLRRVAGLLSFLHDTGCGRDKAGNRELHFDDYVLLILLYLFNPMIDSTVIDTLCTVAEAMFLPTSGGRHSHAWRLHLQFDVDRHVPGKWEITDPRNSGKSDEKSVLRRKLSPGHTYVMDRWYAQFTLWNDIQAAGSSYVCRVRDNSVSV